MGSFSDDAGSSRSTLVCLLDSSSVCICRTVDPLFFSGLSASVTFLVAFTFLAISARLLLSPCRLTSSFVGGDILELRINVLTC
jgi:hypothetical protein